LDNVFRLKKFRVRNVSIKWKLFIYLALFTAATLLLLWLFQVVFMNGFYKAIKINSIKSSADNIAGNIDKGNLENIITNAASESNSSIVITDENGVILFSSSFTPENMAMRDISRPYILGLIQKAKANGGSYLEWLDNIGFQDNGLQNEGKAKNNGRHGVFRDSRRARYSIAYTNLAVKKDGSNVAIVIINNNIAPLYETVETIRKQLVYVTLIMLAFALLLAFLISKRISKPIEKMNESAKELAKGNYEIKFEEGEYREIAELGNTLNFTTAELSKNENLRRELIANISHDLRTPLTMIAGYAEVMRDLPGENTQENIQIIIDEAKRLTSLVNDVLDISKLQSGTQPLKPVEFNLTGSIEEILKRYAKFTDQYGYEIKFIRDKDAYVYADELRISQVVYNLLNNAITYTGKEKLITIKQSCSDGKIMIEVIDTGDGIPEDRIPFIWDRYYKIDKEHKRAAIGSGLGLTIVKTILDQHNAGYGVKSTIGQGSIFWFELEICKDI
jgi:Signal transduction histidine kinase